LNIALVILHADSAKGGAETYTVDLARALIDRGHRVSMLAATFADGLDRRIERVPLRHAGATRLGRYLAFLDDLDAHLGRTSYDIVHAMLPVRRCDLYHPHAGVATEAVEAGHLKHPSPLKRTAARLANRLNRKRQRFAAVERSLLSPAGGHRPPVVLCLSDYIQDAVRRHHPLPPDRFATLMNAVDLARFDPSAIAGQGRDVRERLKIRPEQVVALIVAQDFARKGVREAVEAVRRVGDARLVLLVVGKDDFAPYARLVADSPLRNNFIAAGATRDVRPFYAAADFFVLPTRHDPCSLVVLEALAMGLPVISTRFNGACEVMTSGEHGHVLPDPGDVPALADSMRTLLDDDRRGAMRQACLALRPSLSYERHLDRLCGIYQDVIAGRGGTK